MRRIGLIAAREFTAAVMNRGFVIGLLLMPALVALLAFVAPRVLDANRSRISGEVAVIDPTGQVAADLRRELDPDAITRRRAEAAARVLSSAPAAVRDVASAAPPQAADRVLGAVPEFHVVERPGDADLQQEKDWLLHPGPEKHLALIVVHSNAVTPTDGTYGSYDLYVPAVQDDRVESALYDGLREAILGARIRLINLDRRQVDAVTRVARPASVTVRVGTERATNLTFNRTLPFVFAGLLVFGILIGGQTLLTSTLEEKSSRVIEVLLSAVSPLELMAGKILGQMAVSLLVVGLYIAAGIMLLISFAMIGLLDPMLVLYLLLFFLISYLVFASVFGAVGAAVNEMREAQSLMTPVMLALMAPWMMGPIISRDPNSTLAVALSFIPPVNTFAMMTRLATTSPPPAWQVWISIGIGLLSAWTTMWFAAKIFKVGLLMHGKPPSIGTLVRWAREA